MTSDLHQWVSAVVPQAVTAQIALGNVGTVRLGPAKWLKENLVKKNAPTVAGVVGWLNKDVKERGND